MKQSSRLTTKGQHAGDEESREESSMLRNKVLQRETVSKKWAYVIPTMHTQLAFNDLAGTSLLNHMDFLEHAEKFHEQTRLFFYPKIFSQVNAHDIDWQQFQPKFLRIQNDPDWADILLPLLIATLICAGLAAINFRK